MKTVFAVASPNVTDQFIERIVRAVVGGQNGHTAAPHQQGKGGLHQFLKIVNEGRFVDYDTPLFGTQRAGFRGEAPYVETGRKADPVYGYVPVDIPQNGFFRLIGQNIEHLGPVGAVANKRLGHFLVVGKVERILPACLPAFGGFHNGLERLAVRGTNAATFLPDTDPACIRYPVTLIGQ